ncbi:Protein PXR1, partial [Candida tropicalis]
MGLAGTKVKQRFGNDPRNTNWSNDTSRFGHQYLSKMGWKQGSGLGLVSHALTSHVKVSIKTDNVGLGATLHKRKGKDGKLEEDGIAGLDAFQRILGRLNGNEDSVNKVLDDVNKNNIIDGKWGMRFVKGETLSSTWDKESKKLISYKNNEKNGDESKKRNRDDGDEEEDEPKSKKSKKDKK